MAEKTIVKDDIYAIRAVVSRWIADPDVDAVYRMTYPPGGLPFDFEGTPVHKREGGGLKVIPPAAFTPYNAQVYMYAAAVVAASAASAAACAAELCRYCAPLELR